MEFFFIKFCMIAMIHCKEVISLPIYDTHDKCIIAMNAKMKEGIEPGWYIREADCKKKGLTA